jgi:hypothetical protein
MGAARGETCGWAPEGRDERAEKRLRAELGESHRAERASTFERPQDGHLGPGASYGAGASARPTGGLVSAAARAWGTEPRITLGRASLHGLAKAMAGSIPDDGRPSSETLTLGTKATTGVDVLQTQ